MRFIFFERQKLPNEIFKHNMEEKRQFFTDINMDSERNDAEVQVDADDLASPHVSLTCMV